MRFAPTAALAGLLLLAAACALPGEAYRVVPAVSGHVAGVAPGAGASLRLRVVHRESPSLHHEARRGLDLSGRFAFPAVELEVAGHEYSKHYLVYLHLERADGGDRVLWRADLSRRALAGPIELDCDPGRPVEHGQPCRVLDATRHPWLVAAGARTYETLCASCHGEEGSGGRIGGEGARPRAPDLRQIARRHGGDFDREAVAEWIEGRALPAEHGTRIMPIWGDRLSAEYAAYAEGDALIGARLDPLLAWLESIQEPARADADADPSP